MKYIIVLIILISSTFAFAQVEHEFDNSKELQLMGEKMPSELLNNISGP